MGKIVSIFLTFLLLIFPITLYTVRAQQRELRLTVTPGNSIQRAINDALPGSTIFIESGTYYEETYPIIVNKTLTLIGKDMDATIIDGQLTETQIILVKSSGVRILNLTIQNTTISETGAAGIDLYDVQNVEVANCKIKNCSFGIHLKNSSQCRITRNELKNNYISGVYLRQSSYNFIIENTISNNTKGIWVADTSCTGNEIYHNNFLGNKVNKDAVVAGGIWHKGYPSGGNYWSDCIKPDYYWGSNQDKEGSDGICDESYNDLDRYPFMAPLNFFTVGKWNDEEYYISIISNCTISELHFDPNTASISFNARGGLGTGFCRVAILKQILWVESGYQWTVLVNSTSVDPLILDQYDEYTYLYFTFENDEETVLIEIRGTNAIPEFQKEIVLVLLKLFLDAAIIIKVKKKARINPLFNSVNFLVRILS
ncbi:MAG: NosD domain-containing protein [Candidatus Bathyarchaeia archaeon]